MQQKSGIFFAMIAWSAEASRFWQPECPVDSATAYDECWADWYEVCIEPCEEADFDCREPCDEKRDWKEHIKRPDYCDEDEMTKDFVMCWFAWKYQCYQDVKLPWTDNYTGREECDKLYNSRGESILG